MKATLEQWRMFQAVVEHGGFSQAAQAIHKSQSSIHHAVHKLEASLGVELLAVDGRRVQLTAAGELMLRRAEFLLQEAAKVEAVAAGLSAGVETRLTIAVDEAFPADELIQALERVSGEFPLLRIELLETVLTGANELVKSGAAVVGLSPIAKSEGLNEEICQVRFIPVSAPSHSLQQQSQPLTLEDLKRHRQIVVRDSAAHQKADFGWLGAHQRWTVSHLKSSIDLVRRGLGFAWLPEAHIREALAGGQLQRLPLADSLDRWAPFYLNYFDADQLGPAARSFMAQLRLLT
ncbi:LysR family transcriptional regulator [Halioxenophilus sp. WMMB6]|uniref:LysR family transcriptional regulator n=1 Tax=Halioxenophilus sp. WMMB6 TaxID=3073815 RepID=UPI00295ECB7C|nr:LysR family transcriptional regulator [Halioxenophilus sp. WMMB6]